MNIAKDFVEYMESLGLGTFGTNIFISQAPSSPDNLWWIVGVGGNSVTKNSTGERVKDYRLNVYYRSNDAEDVYNTVQSFEEIINEGCADLDNYDVVEMEANVFPSDIDLDNEDRIIGLTQVRIQVYK